MSDPSPPLPPVPGARVVPRNKTRLSLVWIVPIVAAVAGAWVAVTRILGEGPTITISFATAEGLEAGKTHIEYNGVVVGTLTEIRLSDDRANVIATAQMQPKTESFLVEDTRFWVVKARISGANVSGLGTLLSGAYIGMEIGSAKQSERHFHALDVPPVVTGDVAGRFFFLKTQDLGSLDTGTPLFFRHLSVGQVASYTLDADGKALTVKVFVRAPYDQYVTTDTRFWHASGIDVSLGANGLQVETESLVSILVGGIAFETPGSDPVLPPAPAETTFPLHHDRAAAFAQPALDPQTYVVIFDESVRGLEQRAPVELRGIRIGEVADISAQIDLDKSSFRVPVTLHLDPRRLGVEVAELPSGADREALRRKLIDRLVAKGLRAQLRSGNLLTGARYVALDFFPDAPAATIDWSQKPVRIPTLPGEVEELEARVASIVKKIDEMPLKQIGDDLRKSIAELDRTLASAKVTLDHAGAMVAPDSTLSADLGSTLAEVSRAADALRLLMDYLERHPESLLRGKKGEPK